MRERDKVKKRMEENRELNRKEFLEGKTILKSYPMNLGIDIEGRCNFKPSCVYCNFEDTKRTEGVNAAIPFNEQTLLDYGLFFKNAEQLMNCSVGEPFLSEDIVKLLEIFEREKKYLEISTNGLLLNKKIRKSLLGKNISLYVSLDAATKETYAKLRNEYFDIIIENVKQLSKERKKFKGLPRIYLVFMQMKVNLHELEDFVKLCADLKVDMMVLRPLVQEHIHLREKRVGYEFIYKNELLSFDEFQDVSIRAKKYADKYGVNLVSQVDFNIESNNTTKRIKQPLCQEPWTNFYILKRGIKPCSYGYTDIAEMKDFKKVWNGKKIQNIRKHLAKGELCDYCIKSKTCPVRERYLSKNKIGSIKLLELKIFDILVLIYKKLHLQRFKKYFLVFV